MRGRLSIAIAIAVLAAAGPASAAHKPKENTCADPYWADTLRCAAAPDEAPQPNLDDAPPDATDIKPFTRVFLTQDRSVRSVDGTAPAIYVDKAVCTAPAGCGDVPYGMPIDSGKWLFTFQGGGSCSEEDCLAFYADPGERGEMSTAGDPPTKGLGGIHTADPGTNPVFAGFNRVRIEKSSFDRYMGRASWTTEDGTRAFSHGMLIIEEAMGALRNGLRYDTWVAHEGQVVAVRERLPALAKAEQVVFVGHSGGSHGLLHNVDRLTTMLRDLGGFDGDVRAVLDENFIPGAEAEAAFALPSPSGDAYSGVWSGLSSGNGALFSYDGEAFARHGIHAEQYDAWDAPMDASCLAAHPGDEAWRCNDRHHVLFNHVTTPFLVKQDLSDPNPEHNNRPFGHRPQWADAGAVLTPSEFAARVRAQARTLIEDHATRSELGAAFPAFSVWIADCRTHAGVYDDPVFFDSRLGVPGDSVTLREWVERFVAAPASADTTWRIDGLEGAVSGCPGP